MSNILLSNLTFGYGAALLFDRATINSDDSWHLGLVGRNGRGKTTLLKLLAGELTTSATVSADKTFVYFPQQIPDDALLTYNALSALTDCEQWQLERELTLLKADLDILWRPWTSLSGGEQTKCLLALLFLDEKNFPLLDEPTNHLDLPSRKIVADYLKKKTGFIVVSHDKTFLNAVCDHILAIERTKLALYAGNFSTYEEEKAREDAFEQATNDKLKNDIFRLKKSARDKSDWSKRREGDIHGDPRVKNSGGIGHDGAITARAARVMKKSKNLEKRMATEISEKEKLLRNLEKSDSLTLNSQPTHHKILVSADKLQLGLGGNPLFAPIHFELARGEILALTGKNGSGKSSLIQVIQDQIISSESSKKISELLQLTGQLTVAHGLKLSTVRQQIDNRGSLKAFAARRKLDYESFLSALRKLDLPRAAFQQPIETLSQGQQKKVELAASLTSPAQLYLWDEPLNFLDVTNRDQLIALLKVVRPTMILIEHDQYFMDSVATQHLELHRMNAL